MYQGSYFTGETMNKHIEPNLKNDIERRDDYRDKRDIDMV